MWNIYYYYLPTDMRAEFSTPEMLETIKKIDLDWVNDRYPIPVLVSHLETGPTGCVHCEIEQLRSYEHSSDPVEKQKYLQYCQIKNDAPSFWHRFYLAIKSIE